MKTPEEIKNGMVYLSITNVAQKIEAAKKGLLYAYVEEIAADGLSYIQQLEAKNAEYEKALEEGRMVMLPCKPGDDLYWLDDADEEHEGWCVKREAGGVGAVVVRGKDDFAIIDRYSMKNNRSIEKIGERWSYLTEADAQAALKEMDADD